MSSLPQPVEVKDPGHALVTPGHAPVTTASTTPGHAPVDATLAEPKPKKIRTLSSDADIDDIIWAKTVERNAATKVGKDDFSTMEGIEKLLDEHIEDSMQILVGDWPADAPSIGAASIRTYMHTAITPSGGITRDANKIHCPLMARNRLLNRNCLCRKSRPRRSCSPV